MGIGSGLHAEIPFVRHQVGGADLLVAVDAVADGCGSAGAPDEVVDSSMGWLCSSVMGVEVMTGSFQIGNHTGIYPEGVAFQSPGSRRRTLGW